MPLASRQIWHRGDVVGAWLLIEAGSEDEVRDTLAALPLVEAGMLVIDALIRLKPYAGFAQWPAVSLTLDC
jgi:hypothetical protein